MNFVKKWAKRRKGRKGRGYTNSRNSRVSVGKRRYILFYGNEHKDTGGTSGNGVRNRDRSDQRADTIANGGELTFRQEDIRMTGHAIECRINAEIPERNFTPSAGRITDLHLPGGNGIRVDTAVYSGCEVLPYYDSMLAKLIVHGKDRREAVDKMRSALGEIIIEGIGTNVDYQYEISENEDFISGKTDVDFIRRLSSETA